LVSRRTGARRTLVLSELTAPTIAPAAGASGYRSGHSKLRENTQLTPAATDIPHTAPQSTSPGK
jgi:hypothetical protein